MAAVLESHTVLPPTKDASELASLATALQTSAATLVGPDGTHTPLPEEVYRVLRSVVDAMSQGLAITIAPHNTQLTTQEAADLLGISRPTLVRLLEDGEISFQLRGRHRRVMLADVVAYQERARTERRATLDEMTRTASADSTDDTADEFIQTR
ncbi:MAG: helix-turn-helix domain-containing protein [Actinophytocola sp.]|uniref:helix-turn-helix domain-containing protein n=1 Tax=Actinophytocola sp. TaxID=1872138 RepID=UPI0013247EB9|nr:helix-turn-helix domain-containing protein [Actinophytocola sp.]MPZ83166.1 helix-turn-helix domain-containing protein [Actinophytocola sp.]